MYMGTGVRVFGEYILMTITTQFFLGAPPMRPLWVEFPEDEGSYDIDYEHLIGSALLVRPVVTEGANTASVYFPPGVWYDVLDLTTHTGSSSTPVPAPRDKVGLLLTDGRDPLV